MAKKENPILSVLRGVNSYLESKQKWEDIRRGIEERNLTIGWNERNVKTKELEASTSQVRSMQDIINSTEQQKNSLTSLADNLLKTMNNIRLGVDVMGNPLNLSPEQSKAWYERTLQQYNAVLARQGLTPYEEPLKDTSSSEIKTDVKRSSPTVEEIGRNAGSSDVIFNFIDAANQSGKNPLSSDEINKLKDIGKQYQLLEADPFQTRTAPTKIPTSFEASEARKQQEEALEKEKRLAELRGYSIPVKLQSFDTDMQEPFIADTEEKRKEGILLRLQQEMQQRKKEEATPKNVNWAWGKWK